MAEFLPAASEASSAQGHQLEREGDFDGAAAIYREACEDYPQAWVDLGRIHFRQGAYGPALEAFEQARAGDAELAAAHLGVGLVHWEAGRLEEALQAFELSIAQQSGYVPGQYYLGLCYLKQGEPEKALQYAELASRNARNNGKVLRAFGEALFGCKLWLPARDAFRKARSLLYVDDPQLRYLLGCCQRELEKPESARALWEALAEEFEHKPSLRALAELLAEAEPELAAEYRARAEAEAPSAEARVEAAPTPPPPPVKAAPVQISVDELSKLRAAGDPGKAAELGRKALLAQPADAALHLELARCYLALGQKREAVSSLRRALQQRSDWAEAHWELGRLLLEQGDDLTAKRALDAAAKGGIIEAREALGQLFESNDNPARALREYLQVRKAGGAGPALLGRIGELQLKAGERAEARQALEEARAAEPLAQVLVTLAELELAERNLPQAAELVARFGEVELTTSDERIRALRVGKQLERMEEARKRAEVARQKEKEAAEARRLAKEAADRAAAEEQERLAAKMEELRVHEAARREQLAREEAEALAVAAQRTTAAPAAEKTPPSAETKASPEPEAESAAAAELVVESTQAKHAEPQTALEREMQKHGKAQNMLAKALVEAKKEQASQQAPRPGTSRNQPVRPEAREATPEERRARVGVYQEILAAKPDAYLIRARLGTELLKLKETEQAAEHFDTSLARDPNDARSWHGKGCLSLMAGQFSEAVPALEKAVRLDHDLVKSWNNLAFAYGELGKHRDSERSGRSGRLAERRVENTLQTHMHKGHKLGREGRHENAEKEFLAALSKDPERGVLWNKVGTARFERHDYAGAVLFFEEAAFLDPDSAQVHKNLAMALKALGSLEAALVCFENAAVLDPEDSSARNEMGFIALHLGKFEVARAAFEGSLAILSQNPMIHLSLGQVHERLGVLDKAEACYKAAIALRSGQAENHLALGNLYLKMRKLDEARGALLASLERSAEDSSALYSLACLNALQGDVDAAFATLEKAVDAGFHHVEALERDDDLAALREDPRLPALREKMAQET